MCLVPCVSDEHGCGDGAVPVDAAGGVSRRRMIAGSLGAAAAVTVLGGGVLARPTVAVAAPGPYDGDGVVFLGVSGGPILSKVHKQPSLALLVSGTVYLIDAGNDTAAQFVNAGLPFPGLRHLFLTHYHSDHMAGYPALALLGWVQLQSYPRLDLWGPPPLNSMNANVLDLYAVDIASREAIAPTTPVTDLLHPHQVTLHPAGSVDLVMEDDNVIVTGTRVFHGSDIRDAFAYRFDLKSSGRSVVFSGDCPPDPNLVSLAEGADLLVHNVLYWPGIEVILNAVDPSIRPFLEQHFQTALTNVTDLPAIAKSANVKRVAFCHYTPSFPPSSSYLDAFTEANQGVGFTGDVMAPTDLDFIAI